MQTLIAELPSTIPAQGVTNIEKHVKGLVEASLCQYYRCCYATDAHVDVFRVGRGNETPRKTVVVSTNATNPWKRHNVQQASI